MQGIDQPNQNTLHLTGQFDLMGRKKNTSNNVEGAKNLSDHLFSAYQNAKTDYSNSIDRALSSINSKEHLSKLDQEMARMELNGITNKNKILINGCEKAIETLNTLLRMQ